MKYRVGIVVISDRAAAGVRDDSTLPVFEELLDGSLFEIVERTIIPDDANTILSTLERLISAEFGLIFTTGGTGCSPRDVTPEVTRQVLDKPSMGVDEAIRSFSRSKSAFAMYSRGVSGIAGQSFIINLPGSPKAVTEILGFLLPTIEHPLKLIAGQITDCSSEAASHD